MASFVKFFLLSFLGLCFLINQVACGPANRKHVPEPASPDYTDIERKDDYYKDHGYKDDSHDVDKKTTEKIRDRKIEGEKKVEDKRKEVIRRDDKHPKERVEKIEYVEKKKPQRPTYMNEDKTIMTEDAKFKSSYEKETKIT